MFCLFNPRHYEAYQRDIASNHADQRHWFSRFGESMDSFRAAVKNGLTSGAPVPEPKPEPPPAPPTDHVHEVYTVVRGDTLWRIAVNKLGKGARYTEIMALNGLTSDLIITGQKLKIPKA